MITNFMSRSGAAYVDMSYSRIVETEKPETKPFAAVLTQNTEESKTLEYIGVLVGFPLHPLCPW